jgi:hypothetical protein
LWGRCKSSRGHSPRKFSLLLRGLESTCTVLPTVAKVVGVFAAEGSSKRNAGGILAAIERVSSSDPALKKWMPQVGITTKGSLL